MAEFRPKVAFTEQKENNRCNLMDELSFSMVWTLLESFAG